jgi:hypothetical protein
LNVQTRKHDTFFFFGAFPRSKGEVERRERRFTSEHLVFDILKLQVDVLPTFLSPDTRDATARSARASAVLASPAREARLSTSPVSRDGASRYLEIPADERT